MEGPKSALLLLLLMLHLLGRSSGLEPCDGRRIYVHKLPAKFNKDLLLKPEDYEKSRKLWYTEQMLRALERTSVNCGFGNRTKAPVANTRLRGSWYQTDQMALEIIFFARLPYHKCIVSDYRDADLVYVPYFGGHDMQRHMHMEEAVRETLARELATWLQDHPAWQSHGGMDHFWVLGRETWDFRKNPSDRWGNNLLFLEGVKDTVVTIDVEASPWLKNDFSVPKPTGFHPASLIALQRWARYVKMQRRRWLLSFVGGHRADDNPAGRIREKLFWQCSRSEACLLKDCNAVQKVKGGKWVAGCESLSFFMRVYLSSTFCLQPRGDACARRAVLDSLLAGCIPVVFYGCTLEEQYRWHLHGNLQEIGEGKFYVHIPEETVWGANDTARDMVMVEEVLRKIPKSEVRAMRRRIVEMIPRFVFGGVPRANGTISPPDYKDAFDIIIDGLAAVRKRNVAAAEADTAAAT